MKRKIYALLLSALVLPGLGQLFLGRKVKGIAILLLVNLLLLLTVFVLLKGLSPVIASKMISGTFNPNEALAALQGVKGFGQALLAGFTMLWAYSIVDLVACSDKGGRSENG